MPHAPGLYGGVERSAAETRLAHLWCHLEQQEMQILGHEGKAVPWGFVVMEKMNSTEPHIVWQPAGPPCPLA